MSNDKRVQIGDSVIYCHEHYVGRVESYKAIVSAINDDGLLNLDVNMGYQTTVKAIRYDEDGKPSSWHWREQA